MLQLGHDPFELRKERRREKNQREGERGGGDKSTSSENVQIKDYIKHTVKYSFHFFTHHDMTVDLFFN